VRPGHDIDVLPAALEAACAGRWTEDPAALAAEPAGRLFRLALPPHPASATELRRRLAAGEDTGDWLAPAVADEIRARGLYRAG
jgi:nicotinate-nucleotide adenylyltransferase